MKLKQSIEEYFEKVYCVFGIDAEEEVMDRVWNMYNNDEEAFNAFVEKHNIDLEARTLDCPETDFQMWVWDMEG